MEECLAIEQPLFGTHAARALLSGAEGNPEPAGGPLELGRRGAALAVLCAGPL